MPQPILIKLKKERDDLIDKFTDLNTYASSPEFAALPHNQQALVRSQLHHIAAYKSAVIRRVEYWQSLEPA
jgi:hypothetical protein